MMANYNKKTAEGFQKVEPMAYVGKLVLGIFCAFLSLNWIILFIIHAVMIMTGGKTWNSFDYINTLFRNMKNDTDGSTYEEASFTKFLVADLYFILTTIYLLNCTIKGNDTYGYRFACFTFYPVTLNETLCSSFLVNAVIKNLVTASIMQLCVL